MPGAVSLIALSNVPMVEPGDDLAALLIAAIEADGLRLADGDILIVAQKIVSKAENRYRELRDVTPSERALEIARTVGKDPRHVEVVLQESAAIVKVGPRVIVVEHRLGFVMANAGVDESNIPHGDGDGRLLLLPCDPDGSAVALKRRLDDAFGACVGVVINDSFGRPWRNGVVGVAIGAAGVPSIVDRVGTRDLFGRVMKVTEIGLADEIASAGSLLMGQAAEGSPVVLMRGLDMPAPEQSAAALIRSRDRDMFR